MFELQTHIVNAEIIRARSAARNGSRATPAWRAPTAFPAARWEHRLAKASPKKATDAPVLGDYLLSKYMFPKRLLHLTSTCWREPALLGHRGRFRRRWQSRTQAQSAREPRPLRRFAVNILRTYPDSAPIHRKIKRAG